MRSQGNIRSMDIKAHILNLPHKFPLTQLIQVYEYLQLQSLSFNSHMVYCPFWEFWLQSSLFINLDHLLCVNWLPRATDQASISENKLASSHNCQRKIGVVNRKLNLETWVLVLVPVWTCFLSLYKVTCPNWFLSFSSKIDGIISIGFKKNYSNSYHLLKANYVSVTVARNLVSTISFTVQMSMLMVIMLLFIPLY